MPEGSEGQQQQQQQQQQQPQGQNSDALLQEVTKLRADLAKATADGEKAKGYLAQLLELIPDAPTDGDPKGDDEDPVARFKERFEKDPKALMDAHFNERVRPLLENQFQGAIKREYEAAVAKHPELFEKYGEEIMKFMEPMALETKAAPGAWEHAAQFVRTQHFDDELKSRVDAEVAKVKKNYEVTGLVELPTGDNGTVSGDAKPISAVERDIAKKFGMDADEWKKFSGDGGPTAEESVFSEGEKS